MRKEEITIFLIIVPLVILLFFTAAIIVILQLRKKKLQHILEKKTLEENHAQQLLSAQFESQQWAMQFIGREIHDSVGQKLTLASLYNKQLAGIVSLNVNDRMNAIGGIIDESLTELRQLSKTLTNPELINANLLSLLQEEAYRINVLGICTITITHSEIPFELTSEKKYTLFRLLQEFMQNSLKHAHCKKITIDLQTSENTLYIKATDDGNGFNMAETSNGIGLQNMKTRAAQLMGQYQLTSKQGEGTMLTLVIQKM
jgi:signal transduction histidine kinase